MNWLKILIGYGVGFAASLSLIPTLKKQNQENAQNSKMKLSTKSLPSTQDLKQVYIKKNKKPQFQIDNNSNDRKKNNQNSLKTEANQQDFYFNLDNGIRKKIKQQEFDERSSPQDHQSSQSFNDNEGSQNFIKENNKKKQNEPDQFSKKLKDHQFQGKQGIEQILENAQEPYDQQISEQKKGEYEEEKK